MELWKISLALIYLHISQQLSVQIQQHNIEQDVKYIYSQQ